MAGRWRRRRRGRRKKRGALLVAGRQAGRQEITSLGARCDWTGLPPLVQRRPANVKPAPFLRIQPESAERRMPICRKPSSSRWFVVVVMRRNGNSEKRSGWNSGREGGREGDVHVLKSTDASDGRTLPPTLLVHPFVKKERTDPFSLSFHSFDSPLLNFPPICPPQIRGFREQKRGAPSTTFGPRRKGRRETFEAGVKTIVTGVSLEIRRKRCS